MDMLHQAVAALKRGEIPDVDAPLDQGTEVNMHQAALIPDDYLPDINSRLILYKRIAAAANDDELRELQVEMIDRFGLLPPQVGNLFQVSRLRLRAQQLGIRAIEVGPQGGSIDFKENTRVNPLTLVKMVQSEPKTFKLAGANRLRFTSDLEDHAARQRYLEQLLDNFAKDTTEDAA
jgi:transcription-repair coupling factor (superfamily II helicase)